MSQPGFATIKEIAAALNVPVRTAQYRSSSESWRFEKRGNARLYIVSELPKPIILALAGRSLATSPVHPLPAIADLPEIDDLKDYQRRVMNAKAGLYSELCRMERDLGITYAKAVDSFLLALRAGLLSPEIAEMARGANARAGDGERTISRATLYNMRRAELDSGSDIRALAPKSGHVVQIPVWAATLVDLHCRPHKPNLTEALAMWPPEVPKPHYDQARRFLAKLDPISRETGRHGPRELRKFAAYVTRDISKLLPGDVFIGDGHTFKAMVAHPIHGRPFKPEITCFIDVKTRAWIGTAVSLSEHTWAIADALRDAVTNYTVPAIVYYDNGKGIKNRQWDDPQFGLIRQLGIEKKHSLPYNSQARGIIEHFHSTTLHPLARTYPTYVGPRMDKEAKEKAFKITRRDIKESGRSPILPSFERLLQDLAQLRAAYMKRQNSGLSRIVDPQTGKRRHLSPIEACQAEIDKGWNPEPISKQEARQAFMPSIPRRVDRGYVTFINNSYFHSDLVQFHGQVVRVTYDLHDPNSVLVYASDGRRICEAGWDANKRDYFPVSFVEEARKKRAEGRLKRIEDHADEARAELGPPLIEQAPASAQQQIEQAAFEASFDPTPVKLRTHADIRKEEVARVRRALALLDRLETGEQLETEDANWMLVYQRTPEFVSYKRMYDDFGEDALAV